MQLKWHFQKSWYVVFSINSDNFITIVWHTGFFSISSCSIFIQVKWLFFQVLASAVAYTGDLMYIKTFPTLNSLITLYTLQVLPIFKARGCPYLVFGSFSCMDCHLLVQCTCTSSLFQSSQYIDCEELSQTFYTTT